VRELMALRRRYRRTWRSLAPDGAEYASMCCMFALVFFFVRHI
jgi:hypothetical protein